MRISGQQHHHQWQRYDREEEDERRANIYVNNIDRTSPMYADIVPSRQTPSATRSGSVTSSNDVVYSNMQTRDTLDLYATVPET